MQVETLRTRLRWGLIPAVPVPFRDDGSLDEQAQEQYADWMSRQPVAGVAVWAHTGRGLLLDHEQRRRVLAAWRAAMPDKIIICGVGGHDHDPQLHRASTLRMAEEALAGGADALMAYAPVLYRTAPDPDAAIVAYHEAIAGLDAPLLLFYLYEAAGGISYSPDVLRYLFAIPQVAGIKMATLDSVMTYQDVAALITREFPHTLLITGEDRFLGYSIQLGAQAALIGMGAARTSLQAALLQTWREQDLARFVALSKAVDDLALATFRQPMEGYIRRMLWVLAHDGIIPQAATADPWGPALPDSDQQNVCATLARLPYEEAV